METAPSPSTAALSPGSMLADNGLREYSLDALVAGAGNPTVRAGVIRVISSISEGTVTHTTANGEPARLITGAFPGTSKCLTCGDHVDGGVLEQMTIDATTGIPVTFSGGAIGQPPTGQTTYQVRRVTLDQVAQGQFKAEPTTSTAGA
ncbi:MAG: hypothetical protein WAM97_18450 [Acidimicrobiales bacterium]